MTEGSMTGYIISDRLSCFAGNRTYLYVQRPSPMALVIVGRELVIKLGRKDAAEMAIENGNYGGCRCVGKVEVPQEVVDYLRSRDICERKREPAESALKEILDKK